MEGGVLSRENLLSKVLGQESILNFAGTQEGAEHRKQDKEESDR